MNWSNLPYHITEKIIKYAAEKDEESLWLMKLHKYGQVCRGWKEVIFQSKMLFDNDKETNESDDDSKREMQMTLKTSDWFLCGEPTEQQLRQMINFTGRPSNFAYWAPRPKNGTLCFLPVVATF